MIISSRWAYLAVFVGVFGHASSEFFAVLSGLPGPEVSVWRFLLGGLGMIMVALSFPESRNLLEPLKKEGVKIVGYSLVGVTGAYLAFHWALDFASVIQVATLVTTIPIFVGIANLFINGQALTKAKLATGICAVAALVLLITDGAMGQLLHEDNSIFGILLGITCAACTGYYIVKIKPIITSYGALRVTALSIMIGGIGLWCCVALFFGSTVNVANLFDMKPIVWGAILILAFWNTTITQYLWIGGLAAAPDITRASYLFFLKPVIAAILATAFLGEELSWLKGGAIIIVTGSVFIELFFSANAKVSR